MAACKKTVIAACSAGICTCGTGGTCDGSTLCATTTTTPTTTTSSTTSTTCAPSGLSLKYTTASGTTSCGGAGFSTPASAPFSGEIDSDTACSVKINDLGASCLYIGGGLASTVPPGAEPAGASSYLDIACPMTGALVASNGTGMRDCTKGSSTTMSHCLNVLTACTTSADCTAHAGPACTNGSCVCTSGFCTRTCTTDADCAGTAGACEPVENCFFGPPRAIQSPAVPALAACVIDVIATDASGTGDPTTGCASVDIPLQSRVYLTGNEASPCPQCNCGTPPCSGTGATGCTAGPNVGGACSTNSTTGNPATSNTTQDCPPEEGQGLFNGALAVDLNPLTTGTASKIDLICPSQAHGGAFGTLARCITETGMCAGNETDGLPHAATEATVFCIPATSNGTVNIVADLPGPGATSLPGVAQIVPTP